MMASEGRGSSISPSKKPPLKAWEAKRFEHLRWSYPETFAKAKRVHGAREEFRALTPAVVEERPDEPPVAGNSWQSPRTPGWKFLSLEGTSISSMGLRIARAFQKREEREEARKKYLGGGGDAGKGHSLYAPLGPTVFEESGSMVPQRALKFGHAKRTPAAGDSEEAMVAAAAPEDAEEAVANARAERQQRSRVRLITARRHTSHKRKPNGGFYSSDAVAGKVWEYHTEEYKAITTR